MTTTMTGSPSSTLCFGEVGEERVVDDDPASCEDDASRCRPRAGTCRAWRGSARSRSPPSARRSAGRSPVDGERRRAAMRDRERQRPGAARGRRSTTEPSSTFAPTERSSAAHEQHDRLADRGDPDDRDLDRGCCGGSSACRNDARGQPEREQQEQRDRERAERLGHRPTRSPAVGGAGRRRRARSPAISHALRLEQADALALGAALHREQQLLLGRVPRVELGRDRAPAEHEHPVGEARAPRAGRSRRRAPPAPSRASASSWR